MKLPHKNLTILFILIFTIHFSLSGSEPPYASHLNDPWVEQNLKRMSLEEKIGQLIMVPVYPKLDLKRKQQVIADIKKHKIGGILVMQGTPHKTVNWINEFQSISSTPLLVAIDGEWGASMRIDSVLKYPYAQTLGAVSDSSYLIKMGKGMASQLKAMGIHMNFAPVADINTNPANPVINFRSFGENKIDVAQKAWYLTKGMQNEGVIAVAKHFPGHGDTDTDSHKTLPYLAHSRKRIDQLESYPFRYLSERGISGIMTAHLNVPSLDDSGTPSSLSSKIIKDYLKKEIGFKGFVVTDALNMKGVSSSGKVALEALMAGNDLAEFVPDVGKAIQDVMNAIQSGQIDSLEIHEKCRTILTLKKWTGLQNYHPTPTTNLLNRLNSADQELTIRKLIQSAITPLKADAIPLQELDKLKIASLTIGGKSVSRFQKMLGKYASVDHFVAPKEISEQDWLKLKKELSNYNLVIGGIEGIHIYPARKYGTSEMQRRIVSEIVNDQRSILLFFGNAYALKHFNNIHHADGLLLAYQNTRLTQELAAQAVFGAFPLGGRLPVTVDKRFKLNQGIEVKKNDILSFSLPQDAGINGVKLENGIDSIAELGIREKAFPGCQVLVARNGKVIFHKCYGYHTYDSLHPVGPDDIYDWASITKVTGPLPAIMKMVDQNKLHLDAPFSRYWPDFKESNKSKVTLREVLAHQARFKSWIPFWTMTVESNSTLSRSLYKKRPSKDYAIRVSDKLFLKNDFKQEIYDTIRASELIPRKKYLYSGLSFYLFPEIISRLNDIDYETYIQNNFFNPLGAHTVTYNAYKHYPKSWIVPTEKDDFFRKAKLHGYVHDEGAAMMGGVSGNAGLFGTTVDLAKIFQMYLQKGYYGGKRYIKQETLNEFIRIQYKNDDNRRGLGFDKPYIDNHKKKLDDAYPAVSAGKDSFGHSGFTGTFAWADPNSGVLFLFMSNRVYPTRNNNKLYELNIRPAMHQIIYDSFETGLKNVNLW